ncbi:MAG: hypothetical protein QOE55_3986 [Acidobacteriaceae bacterium]|nr:hypothetical protein [Acidobacteriaceae bacterium]
MPTYAEFGGWVISTIAGWFVVTADMPELPMKFRGSNQIWTFASFRKREAMP